MSYIIYNEDCIGLNGMAILPDKSINLILADLPYGTTRNKWDSIIPLEPLWEQYKRIITDDGAILLTATQPFTTTLINSNPDWFRFDMVWKKSLKTNYLNAHRQPLRNHESILVFYRRSAKYNPRTESCEKVNRRGRIGTAYLENYGNEYIQTETGYPVSVIEVPSEGGGKHNTRKPVALMEYLISLYTEEGDTVLDNAMGSGTTGFAALNLGRKFIGFEKDKDIYESAKTEFESIKF